MDKFFSFFGKAVLILLFVGALAGGGYYLGRSEKINLGGQTQKPEAVSTTSPQESPMPTDIGLMPEKLPEELKKPTTMTAGLGSESGLSFTKYQIAIPDGWTADYTSENEGTPVDTLVVKNGAYEVKIFQAATGGAMCLYPGDGDFEGPSSRYDTYVAFTTADGVTLRRGGTSAASGTKRGFTVCQKSGNSYGQPTVFGHVSYTTPLAPDEAMLKVMDEMIRGLKKV